MYSLPSWIVDATLLLIISALIVENIYRRRMLRKESEQNKRKQQQFLELLQELKDQKKDLGRKGEIADQFPLIAKKLTEKRPQKDSFPAIAVRSTKELFSASQVGFFVPLEGSSDFTLEVGVGFPPDWQGKIRIKSDEGILGLALQKKVVIARTDLLSLAGRRLSQRSLEQLGINPDFVAPVFGISEIIGALVIGGCPFPLDEERKNVSMLVDLLSNALQNAALIDLSKTSVWVDHLTGVSNRLYFAQRFESEIRRAENYHQPLALIMIDIDEFKKINDTYGHPAGDVVIKKIAQIIRKNTRGSDLVSRFGGDEFIVLIAHSDEGGHLFRAEGGHGSDVKTDTIGA